MKQRIQLRSVRERESRVLILDPVQVFFVFSLAYEEEQQRHSIYCLIIFAYADNVDRPKFVFKSLVTLISYVIQTIPVRSAFSSRRTN